jgi:predicted nucleic acid-binding protein
MTLNEIVTGTTVFIDANIFIYHFAGRSENCTSFLARVEKGELQGVTGPTSILEAAHRLMTLEAIEHGISTTPNPASRLSRQPQLVRRLSKYYFSLLAIPRFGVEVLPLPQDFVIASQEFRQSYGLLVNDSLVPMHMRQAGVSALASGDEGFDKIPGIKRFHPSDV